MQMQAKRELLISKGWIQAAAIVGLIGMLLLGMLAYRTYTGEPPIPAKVIGSDGQLLFTGEDVLAGQEVFLKNGLMEYGSIFGHGAYLGPDFTADYLHRAALISDEHYAADAARQQTVADFKANRYDEASGDLTFSVAQTDAFNKLVPHYGEFFATPDTRNGLRPSAITDPQQIRQMTAFFAWSAWTASALRPNLNYSYTNNWPPEPLVGNHATADALVWSVLSLIALLGGTGLLLAAFGRWNFLGWHGKEDQQLSFRSPDKVTLTPAQKSCAWFFLIMTVLWLLSGPYSSLQHCSNVACSIVAAVGDHIVSGGRDLSGSYDRGQGAATSALAFLRFAVCPCIRGFWKYGGRICGHSRMDSTRMVLVWRPGL